MPRTRCQYASADFSTTVSSVRTIFPTADNGSFLGRRHLVSENKTLDGNFKLNQFYKRDNSTDLALTDGAMYFALKAKYDRIVESFIIAKEDEVNQNCVTSNLSAQHISRNHPVEPTSGLYDTKARSSTQIRQSVGLWPLHAIMQWSGLLWTCCAARRT